MSKTNELGDNDEVNYNELSDHVFLFIGGVLSDDENMITQTVENLKKTLNKEYYEGRGDELIKAAIAFIEGSR